MTRERHKVAANNLQPTLLNYHHLSPVAPPPRLVEEQESTSTNPPPSPPTRPRWKKFAKKYDPERRRERKRANSLANKIQNNNEIVATAESNLQYWISKLDKMEKALSATVPHSTPPAPPDATLEAAIDTVMETALPIPPTWRSENTNVQWVNAAECLSEAQLKQMVLSGEIDTAFPF